ncbi:MULTISPECIES: hypothetical protein [unclassified Leclercia]|uniref:Uncharacterized protein n=1 Tax=Leclercia barmai TaxID=2785629 RepID=A0ABS7RT88_9ENTR|nr:MULTISPECIES: hypothetical protein [unclassified Leclercia]MBZ0057523.1 hypothetical protein [Leclercia sp. EMC7]MCM5695684.1 hypothetical protein [Leclercia sp. LTM01]MCM5700093.1 hypothetical protein [Leclercia sp. LTM14]
MKIYKAVILAIWLCLSAIPLLTLVDVCSGGYLFLLLMLAAIGYWFNWKYAEGEWPEMSFWKACSISLLLSVAGLSISFISLADRYQRSVDAIAELLFDYSPQIYFRPLVIIPINLLIWRWLFKERRTARLAIASVLVPVENA